MKKILLSIAVMSISIVSMAQDVTVETILDNYFEAIGGRDAWNQLEGHVLKATANQQGMEIPLEIYSMKDGRSITNISVMGMELSQGAFDGEVSWGTNFMSMQPELSDDETTENAKRGSGDYPDPFLNYADKGYSVELMENETIDGIECFKLKLTKKPMLADGEEIDNIGYYFFDTENFVRVYQEQEIMTGEMKGEVAVTTFSDYQEVEGLMFPFSISQGMKDGESQPLEITEIELNPEVADDFFSFPEE